MSEYLNRVSKIKNDPDQWAAFNSQGSQVVIAGPGSGKTYLLTTKAAKVLLEEQGVRYPQKIACITFSRQLADKLVREFRKLGVYDSERMYVGTIHAFCIAEILMPAGGMLPTGTLPEPFRIASAVERKDALADALKKQNKPFKNMSLDLDKFRRRHFQPEEYDFLNVPFRDDVDGAQLAGDYHQYLRHIDAMDFVQIEMLALHILKTRPSLTTTLAARYPWWFVDEYQDLSPLFHQMVMTLVQSGKINVFAIGDPNQCIYEALQGSKPESLGELSGIVQRSCKSFPIVLRKNYRSSQNLIDFSNLILGTQTPYQSNQETIGQIHHIRIQRYPYEQLVLRILKKIGADDKRSCNMVILAPKRNYIKALLPSLEHLSVDFSIDKAPEFSANTELLEWLGKVAQWCSGVGVYFYDLLPFWYRFCQLQGEHDNAKRFETEQKLFDAIWALRNGDMPLPDWLGQIQETVLTSSRLKDYRKLRPDDVEEFEKLIDVVTDSPRLQQQTVRSFSKQDAQIFLTTFHSSKGLEFDTAIVVNLDGIREDQSTPDLDSRIAYVAVSRAKSELYILELVQRVPGKFAQRLRNSSSIDQFSSWTCNRSGKITRHHE